MKNKLIKILVVASIISVSLNAFAEDVWLRAYPGSFTMFTQQRFNPGADFKFKMYNPTDQPKSFSYTAKVCPESLEVSCVTHTETRVVQPKEWWTGDFSLATYIEYDIAGTYDLSANIMADGTEHVEHTRHGTIIIYPRNY